MPEPIVAPEVAAKEFERMCAAYRVDISEEAMRQMGPLELTQLALAKQLVCDAMKAGRFLVQEDGSPVYTPRSSVRGVEKVRFKRPTGACFMAMDSAADKPYTRLALAAQELCGLVPGAMSQFEADDFNFIITVTKLFLAQG